MQANPTQAFHTLPTPPSDGTDGFKPPGQSRDNSYQSMVSGAAVQQPTMASTYDTPPQPSSLTARRPAANGLPSLIELPMPPFGNQPAAKPIPVTNVNPTATAQANIGNLLTPPSTVPGDSVSPLSSIMGSTGQSAGGVPPPTHGMSAWLPPPASTTPLGMSGGGTGTTPNSWTNAIGGMFSPSILGSLPGSNPSPSNRTGVPPPPFHLSSLPPFPGSNAVTTSSSTLPGILAQQQTMGYANQNSNQMQTQHSIPPLSNSDPYGQRPQSTPTHYYSNSQPATAAQSAFPPYNVTSPPLQQGPMSAPLTHTRLSPITPQNGTFSPTSASPYGYRPMGGYSLPALNGSPSASMGGPVLTNMPGHGGHVNMINVPGQGMNAALSAAYMPSGHAAQLYGAANQPAMNERPFKCDECPQSFNRNHDLKRHKRIHLAVKPFPCKYCDKSFSRKDALKRHCLVKGCGKGSKEERRSSRQDSPDARSESSDDSGAGSGR